MVPRYQYVICRPSKWLCHSAKGSTWEKHKYEKVVDGVYYYPNSYSGGRHLNSETTKNSSRLKKALTLKGNQQNSLSDLANATKKKTSSDTKDTTNKKKEEKQVVFNERLVKEKKKKNIEKLANDVIAGKYGVGQERMNKLGKKYDKVQNKVNQILLGSTGAKKVLEKKQSSQKTGKLVSEKTGKLATEKTGKVMSLDKKKKKK